MQREVASVDSVPKKQNAAVKRRSCEDLGRWQRIYSDSLAICTECKYRSFTAREGGGLTFAAVWVTGALFAGVRGDAIVAVAAGGFGG